MAARPMPWNGYAVPVDSMYEPTTFMSFDNFDRMRAAQEEEDDADDAPRSQSKKTASLVTPAPQDEGLDPWIGMKNGQYFCTLCNNFATEDHLASAKHQRKVDLHTSRNGPCADEILGPVADLPYMEMKKDSSGIEWPWCLLCRAWVDEGHLASSKHEKRAANWRAYLPASDVQTSEISTNGNVGRVDLNTDRRPANHSVPSPDDSLSDVAQLPYIEMRQFEGNPWLWCLLCGNWVDEGHLASNKHVKRASNWQAYLEANGRTKNSTSPRSNGHADQHTAPAASAPVAAVKTVPAKPCSETPALPSGQSNANQNAEVYQREAAQNGKSSANQNAEVHQREAAQNGKSSAHQNAEARLREALGTSNSSADGSKSNNSKEATCLRESANSLSYEGNHLSNSKKSTSSSQYDGNHHTKKSACASWLDGPVDGASSQGAVSEDAHEDEHEVSSEQLASIIEGLRARPARGSIMIEQVRAEEVWKLRKVLGMPWSRDDPVQLMEDTHKDSYHFALHVDQVMATTCSIFLQHSCESSKLLTLVTRPELRGCGLASFLLRECLYMAREYGAYRSWCEASADSESFFSKRGFRRIGPSSRKDYMILGCALSRRSAEAEPRVQIHVNC